MEKIMPLELLASIKGAASSEDVDALFDIIRKAVNENMLPESTEKAGTLETGIIGSGLAVSPDRLRSDEAAPATELEKEIIKKNFPGEKNGFLVVPRVIED